MKPIKQYTVKIVSAEKAYDEKQLFRNIFESLYSIRKLSCAANPVVFSIYNQFYIKMIMLGRDMPLFEGLLYAPVKSTAASDGFYPQFSNYAQMLLRKEKVIA